MAQIEVHIYKNNEGKTIAFNRTFNQAGKETFSVDGKATSHREYLRRIKEFNIQIDNLCQFLPQDRVQDFAKMNAQEILKNTQSSVCDADVPEMFDQLVEKRQKQLESERRSQDIQVKLREAEQRNEELKGAIENMKERQSYTKKLNMCTKKKAWMEYEIAYGKLKETEGDLAQAKKETAKAQDKLKPLQNRIDELKQTKAKIEKAVKQAANYERSFVARLDEADEGLERGEAQIKKAKSELQDALSQVRDRETEINEARRYYAVLVEDLKRAHNASGSQSDRDAKMADAKRNLDALKREIDKLHNERSVITSQLDETVKPQVISLERRIRNMENVKQRRLEFLQHHHEDTYKAVLWLRNNQHEFKGKVYEPMMMELNVRDTNHVKYLENAVNNRDLIAFTCECKEDMAVFMQKIRTEQRLNANVVHSPRNDKLMYSPTVPLRQIQQYGFTNYLIDVVEGPVAILNILCQLFGIHNIPFGNDEVYKRASQVPNEIRSFYSSKKGDKLFMGRKLQN
jgi:structural maintenance of chromosomes protein 5